VSPAEHCSRRRRFGQLRLGEVANRFEEPLDVFLRQFVVDQLAGQVLIVTDQVQQAVARLQLTTITFSRPSSLAWRLL
jgi:hypothetical protein